MAINLSQPFLLPLSVGVLRQSQCFFTGLGINFLLSSAKKYLFIKLHKAGYFLWAYLVVLVLDVALIYISRYQYVFHSMQFLYICSDMFHYTLLPFSGILLHMVLDSPVPCTRQRSNQTMRLHFEYHLCNTPFHPQNGRLGVLALRNQCTVSQGPSCQPKHNVHSPFHHRVRPYNYIR